MVAAAGGLKPTNTRAPAVVKYMHLNGCINARSWNLVSLRIVEPRVDWKRQLIAIPRLLFQRFFSPKDNAVLGAIRRDFTKYHCESCVHGSLPNLGEANFKPKIFLYFREKKGSGSKGIGFLVNTRCYRIIVIVKRECKILFNVEFMPFALAL